MKILALNPVNTEKEEKVSLLVHLWACEEMRNTEQPAKRAVLHDQEVCVCVWVLIQLWVLQMCVD